MLLQRGIRLQPALEAADGLIFNFAAALRGITSSPATQRAYLRWVDGYLVAMAGLLPARGDARAARMGALPVAVLHSCLTAAMLRAWLGGLAAQGHSGQGIEQSRAAIVTLALLLAEADLLLYSIAAAMRRVRSPNAESGQRPGRWLTVDEIKRFVVAARQVARSEAERQRNHILALLLCVLALRRSEAITARWDDLSLQDNRVVLRIHGKGSKVAYIDVPAPVLQAVDRWRLAVAPDGDPPPESPLIRRIWKSGRVADDGLSSDGVWFLVSRIASYAGLGHVAPHDLRRSVAGALYGAGTAIDTISRLLRHSSIAVTEAYLDRLSQQNNGALTMSDLLEGGQP